MEHKKHSFSHTNGRWAKKASDSLHRRRRYLLFNFWDTPEAREFIEQLRNVPQPWPYEFMWALNSIIPMIGVESVILRESNGILKVLLTQRDKSDPSWPLCWHVPGSTLQETDVVADQASELNFRSALLRIWKKELELSEDQIRSIVAKKCDSVSWRHDRGACVSVIFVCSGYGIEFPVGKFFPVEDLPEPFLGEQKIVVDAAVNYYRTQHGETA